MATNSHNRSAAADSSLLSDLDLNDLHDESLLRLLDEPFDANGSNLRLLANVKYKGFDLSAGNVWIYPTNFPIRQYQFNISRASLFKNTLVALPTGLGKTFIAAVVMYNMFRWYPNGKIIFMAPTRPLVAQQIDACYQIMGIPKDKTAELTGKQVKKKRAIEWSTKRVFFATPQVVWSDLNDPEIDFPMDDVKLLVIDEAHKAKGKYAYVEVVQSMAARNKAFRVLALSATPGRDIKDVVEVVQNLLISHIEIRCENSIDVAPFVFKKSIKTKVVPLGDVLAQIRLDFMKLVDPYVRNLSNHKVIQGHTGNLSKGWLILDQKKFCQSAAANRNPDYNSIKADFSMCISLYHALELLERHGVRVFLNYFADKKNFVFKDVNIRRFVDNLEEQMGANPFPVNDTSFYGNVSAQDMVGPIDYGHPKFDLLRECVIEHFENRPESKVIIFCEYRESVFLINRMLIEESRRVKPKVFVGQGSSHARTITQKEQIAIMNSFKSGACNTLIATCVAEEGIDVGEVDLIVCFDVNNKNPTRYIQRIGRTGRKRQGQVIMLVTEGKEQNILREVMATKDGTNQKIAKSGEVTQALYRESPRMVPPELHPKCMEVFIKCKDVETTVAADISTAKPEPSTSKVAVKSKTKTNKRSQSLRSNKQPDIRHAFAKPNVVDEEIFRDFDVPETLNMSTTSHESYREPVSERLSVSRSSTEMTIEEKFTQICRRYHEIKKCTDVDSKPADVATVVNSNVISKALKLSWLKDNVEIVREHYAKQKTSRLYSGIAKIFGGDQAVQRFLTEEPSEIWSNIEPERQLSIYQMLTLIERKDEESDSDGSLPPPFVLESQMDFECVESRFASQFESQMQQTMARTESRTKNTDGLPSSTPKKMNEPIVTTKMPRPIDSPIVKNATMAERTCATDCKSIPDTVPHYLRYLGLSSIDDLFSDSDDDDAPAQPTQKIDVNDNKIPANDMAETDLFADESENSSKSTNESKVPMLLTRKLNVGSVSDLFGDDSDDDVGEEAVTDALKTDTIDSDATEDYDFDAIISVVDAAEAALNKEGSQKENKNTNQAAAVVQQKSDDLFATYNETIETNANRSNVNETNASKFFAAGRSAASKPKLTPSEPRTPSSRPNSSVLLHEKSPSVLNRSYLRPKTIATTSQNVSSTAYRSDGNATVNQVNIPSPSATTQARKLNFSRLRLNAAAVAVPMEDADEEIPSSQFLTCREVSTSERNAANDNKTNVNMLYTSFSTESETPDEDEVFATCPTVKPPETKQKPRKPKRRKKLCAFIDDEAGVSGDDSSDEELDDFLTQQQMDDTNAIDEGDPSVDMHAKYLQSIRSPQQTHVRIPPIGYRNTNATVNIFSQFVEPDVSTLASDSFVVSDVEYIEEDESELERAERIIKEMRRKKRRLKQNGQVSDDDDVGGTRKRRRIVILDSDSD